MNHQFTFFKGRENIEVIKIPVSDPAGIVANILNVDGNIDPSKLTKIELIVGDVVISSPSEITWSSDIITITPTEQHLATLAKKSYSELVIYNGGLGNTISTGYTLTL